MMEVTTYEYGFCVEQAGKREREGGGRILIIKMTEKSIYSKLLIIISIIFYRIKIIFYLPV